MSHTHDCQMAVSMNLPLPDGSRKIVATAGAVPSTMTRAERRCGCWQATPSAAARLSAMAETLAAGATSWNESWLGLVRVRGNVRARVRARLKVRVGVTVRVRVRVRVRVGQARVRVDVVG